MGLRDGAYCAPSSCLARAAQQTTKQSGYRSEQPAIVGARSRSTTRVDATRGADIYGDSRATAQEPADQAGYRGQQAAISGITACQTTCQTTDQTRHGSEQAAVGCIAAAQAADQTTDQARHRSEQAAVGCIAATQAADQTTDQTCHGSQQAAVGGITTTQTACQTTNEARHRSEQAAVGCIAATQAADQTTDQTCHGSQQTAVGCIATTQATRQTTEQAGHGGQQATVGCITTAQSASQSAEQAGYWREQAAFAITCQPASQRRDSLCGVIQGIAQRVGVSVCFMQEATDRGNSLTQVVDSPTQTQRSSAINLSAHIAQGAAYTTQQSIDRLANTQTITHLLSNVGDRCANRSDYGVQCLADIAQDGVQANWQNVVDCLAYVCQGRFEDRGGISTIEQAAQSQLPSQGIQQAAFTQQGVCQCSYTAGCMAQDGCQRVRVVGVSMKQATCAAHGITQTGQQATNALAKIQGQAAVTQLLAQVGDNAANLLCQAVDGLAQAGCATNLLSQTCCCVHDRSNHSVQCLAQLAAGILQTDWQDVVDRLAYIIQCGFQGAMCASGRVAAVVATAVVAAAVITAAVITAAVVATAVITAAVVAAAVITAAVVAAAVITAAVITAAVVATAAITAAGATAIVATTGATTVIAATSAWVGVGRNFAAGIIFDAACTSAATAGSQSHGAGHQGGQEGQAQAWFLAVCIFMHCLLQ